MRMQAPLRRLHRQSRLLRRHTAPSRGIPRIKSIWCGEQAVYIISRTYRSPLRMRAWRYSLCEHVEL